MTVSLCILSHFLCYYAVQEYHYTTLLLTLPVLLWLWQRKSVPWFRWLLMTSFVVSLLVFAPTPCFLERQGSQRFENINQLQRLARRGDFPLPDGLRRGLDVASPPPPKLITSQMIGQISRGRLGGSWRSSSAAWWRQCI